MQVCQSIYQIKTHLLLGFLFLFYAVIIPRTAFSELVDKVVAVVNDDIITLSEVEEEAAGLYRAIAQKDSEQTLLSALAKARETTLNALIIRKLIAQKAEQFHVSVSEEEIENGYAEVRARSGLSETAFKKELEQSGMTEKSYKANLMAQLLQRKLVGFDVRSKVVVTDAMILDYYDENYTYRMEKGSYYLLQIGFSWEKDSDAATTAEKKERTLKRAERVRNLAMNGQDFRMLAKKFSDLPSAADGGDIGTFKLDEMAPDMRTAVASLTTGAISKIIETDAGYQFFKLLSGDDNAIVVTASYEEVKDEIKQKIFNNKMKEAYSDWVKELQDKAYIQKL